MKAVSSFGSLHLVCLSMRALPACPAVQGRGGRQRYQRWAAPAICAAARQASAAFTCALRTPHNPLSRRRLEDVLRPEMRAEGGRLAGLDLRRVCVVCGLRALSQIASAALYRLRRLSGSPLSSLI